MKGILPTGIVMKNIEGGGDPGDCMGCSTTLPETLDGSYILSSSAASFSPPSTPILVFLPLVSPGKPSHNTVLRISHSPASLLKKFGNH